MAWNQFNTQAFQNPAFPTGYQPWNPQAYPQQQQNQPQSKLVEALPADSLEEAEHCPMAQGTSAIFFAKDDSFIATKRVGFNGEIDFKGYALIPPAPPAPAPDYATHKEVEEMIAAALAKKGAAE